MNSDLATLLCPSAIPNLLPQPLLVYHAIAHLPFKTPQCNLHSIFCGFILGIDSSPELAGEAKPLENVANDKKDVKSPSQGKAQQAQKAYVTTMQLLPQ